MAFPGEAGAAKGARISLGSAISRVTSILCIPYGYTVSLGCAALLSVVRGGSPTELDVLLFAAGAVSAFVGLAGLGWRLLATEVPMRVPSFVVINLFPLFAVLAILAFPAARFGRGVGYFLNAFLVTAVYVRGLAASIRMLGRGVSTASRRAG